MIQKTKKLIVPHQKQTIPIKIILVGDPNTGKTTAVNRYLKKKFTSQYKTTLGVEYYDKHIQIKDTTLHLNIWDFSGKLQFLDLRNQFYKEANIALIFVDLASKKTLQSVDYWIREIKQNGGNNCPLMLVGAKSDIKKVQQGNKVGRQKGCTYFEISSREENSVDLLFAQIINMLQ